jgi:ubiquinone/menaquinone biosynthesis C-methylase UbiE
MDVANRVAGSILDVGCGTGDTAVRVISSNASRGVP